MIPDLPDPAVKRPDEFRMGRMLTQEKDVLAQLASRLCEFFYDTLRERMLALHDVTLDRGFTRVSCASPYKKAMVPPSKSPANSFIVSFGTLFSSVL
jgi:hypothetical protein